jgi:hypothetical protein
MLGKKAGNGKPLDRPFAKTYRVCIRESKVY